MPLFGRRHTAPQRQDPGIPGLAGTATAQGWQPVDGPPFEPDIVDHIHDTTRAMYGASRPGGYPGAVGQTTFSDAFRASVRGQTVIVANSNTPIDPGLMQRLHPNVGVCAVEVATLAPPSCIQPSRMQQVVRWRGATTGYPAFDDQFRIITADPGRLQAVLTPDVQQRIMMRDDWVFWLSGYLFICISQGEFRSVDQITGRIGEVLGILGAIPDSVLPSHVDHSADDLAARISRLEGIEDALAFLQGLTPAERERLARSDTPLAAFADVQTPEEAMARFGTLDEAARMRLLAMFSRVDGTPG